MRRGFERGSREFARSHNGKRYPSDIDEIDGRERLPCVSRGSEEDAVQGEEGEEGAVKVPGSIPRAAKEWRLSPSPYDLDRET